MGGAFFFLRRPCGETFLLLSVFAFNTFFSGRSRSGSPATTYLHRYASLRQQVKIALGAARASEEGGKKVATRVVKKKKKAPASAALERWQNKQKAERGRAGGSVSLSQGSRSTQRDVEARLRKREAKRTRGEGTKKKRKTDDSPREAKAEYGTVK